MMLNIQIWIKCRVRTLKGTAQIVLNESFKKLAHRAAFLDFLVKSRLEPRNTASSTPKVGKISLRFIMSPYYLRHLGREWLAIYKLTMV